LKFGTAHARGVALGAGPLGVALVLVETQWPIAGPIVAVAVLVALALLATRLELAAWWATEAWTARALVVLAVLGLFAGPLWGPISARAHTSEVVRAFEAKRPLDPWGRPWCIRPGVVYSSGPNGVDETGQGDDVDVLRTGNMGALSPTERLLAEQIALVLAGTLLPLIVVFATAGEEFFLAPRSESLASEAARALAIAAPLTLVLAPAAFVGFEMSFKHQNALEATLVPAPFAAAGTVAFVCFLGAFAWRIARPLSPPA
jgi:hypothetical protein